MQAVLPPHQLDVSKERLQAPPGKRRRHRPPPARRAPHQRSRPAPKPANNFSHAEAKKVLLRPLLRGQHGLLHSGQIDALERLPMDVLIEMDALHNSEEIQKIRSTIKK